MAFAAGQLLPSQMRKVLLTPDKVQSELRKAGLANLEDVLAAVMEPSGHCSIIPYGGCHAVQFGSLAAWPGLESTLGGTADCTTCRAAFSLIGFTAVLLIPSSMMSSGHGASTRELQRKAPAEHSVCAHVSLPAPQVLVAWNLESCLCCSLLTATSSTWHTSPNVTWQPLLVHPWGLLYTCSRCEAPGTSLWVLSSIKVD
jgi:hypothetical protein